MSRAANPRAAEQLSAAVWDVLAHQGLEHLTIRAVAAAAGCTTGLVMHRFPNRRALLRHARELLHERTRLRVEALEEAAGSPREALRAVLAQGLASTEAGTLESVVWIGFLAATVGDPELLELHRINTRAWRRRILRLVAATAPSWSADQVSTAALVLMGMAEGAAALASADPETYSPELQEAALDRTLTALGLS
ncbi:TetR/AcrR family transcriptional regulator [Kutzneria buriramensis]|uniref:AcrR family transcriptional regulator n=1 Tax=Kutzneria buriramensis TaxID=1045776 RepID=A0A3E0GYI5_9PSEU|nr:TetR/AcrR family transcriptional regulator [Kutzneria buriramensis]REH32610.1 AcrR family transcriptional regulator [Kutzneria buriramensis]